MPKGTMAGKATMEEITSQEDFKKFVSIMEVTEQIESFDSLDTDSQREVINKFYLWKEKGSPKAEMPKIKDDKEDEILALHRVKAQGDQFIWYVCKDGKVVGKDWVYEYAQEEDVDESGNPLGTFHDDTRRILKRTPKYTVPYNKEVGKKLLDIANKYSDEPICIFEMGKKKVGVGDPQGMFNCDGKEFVAEVQRVFELSRRRR
jgi:hypothetical protein